MLVLFVAVEKILAVKVGKSIDLADQPSGLPALYAPATSTLELLR